MNNQDKETRLIQIAKALGNPVRFRILKFLMHHRGCITNDIVNDLPIAQATVSQHLNVLKEAGLIKGTTEGAATCYCIDEKNIQWFKHELVKMF